jgi:RimJ/RimL family protein N-acetyltransferase
MLTWETFRDPLFLQYNVPFDTIAQGKRWLELRQQERWSYGIWSRREELVGHLSLRQMSFPQSSRLGIALAPRYIGQGYGKAALLLLLDYYFDVLGFREMQLDVCSANQRARQLYLGLGFRWVESFWQKAPAGPLWQRRYRNYCRNGQLRFDEMRLLAEEWTAISACRA